MSSGKKKFERKMFDYDGHINKLKDLNDYINSCSPSKESEEKKEAIVPPINFEEVIFQKL